MRRDIDQRIDDILEAIEKCLRYIAMVEKPPDSSLMEMAEDAIERNLQIIGEAVKHLPAEITDRHEDIAWPQIRGFRNILVHQYFGVDNSVVREVVEVHLPPLAEALKEHRL